jgi:hypothetical protein
MASGQWSEIQGLLTWGTITEAEALSGVDAGQSKAVLAPGETRQHVEDCALPGFYSVHAPADKTILVRTEDGAVTLAARVARPADAVAQERGITRPGKAGPTILRLTAKDLGGGGGTENVAEIKGATYIFLGNDGAMKAVVRNLDGVDANTPLAIWMTQVETFINAIAPGTISPLHPTTIGAAIASTTKLYGG